MEGYQYHVNSKGQPVADIEVGDNEGVMPRSVRLLFELTKKESALGKKKFTVYCSYLQVYKEKIYDLLNKSHLKRLLTDGPGLKLKFVKDYFHVENLYTFECRSAEDVLALFHFGVKNKVIASHNMNHASSRSHSMLKLTLECVDVKTPDSVVTSTLQLVDLAGSEKMRETGTVANKESIEINKSLMTLR
jgi:kinesin family protein 4/21/27